MVWLVIVSTMVARFKPLKINIGAMSLLYIIILLIIVSRTVELNTIDPPYNLSIAVVISGCIATYSKIALGSC